MRADAPLRGVLLLIGAAASFSVMSALVKVAGETMPSPMMVLARAVVTAVLSVGLIRHARLSMWGNAKGLLLLRSTFGFIGLMSFFYAVTALRLADATVIHYLNPVLTAAAAAMFLRERISWALIVALILSVAGVVVVVAKDGDFSGVFNSAEALPPLGVAAALTGAFASAGAYTTVRKLRETDDPLVVVFYFSVIAVPATLPFVIPVFVMPRGIEWLLLLAIGVFTQMGQVLMTRGISVVPAGPATAVGYLQVVFAALWGIIVFGEALTPSTVAGASLIFVGLMINVAWTARRKP
jgi:drug/metabolite transporter (DMT)-like permease